MRHLGKVVDAQSARCGASSMRSVSVLVLMQVGKFRVAVSRAGGLDHSSRIVYVLTLGCLMQGTERQGGDKTLRSVGVFILLRLYRQQLLSRVTGIMISFHYR